jgi:hypothetical protein
MPAISWTLKNEYPVEQMMQTVERFEKTALQAMDGILLESEL